MTEEEWKIFCDFRTNFRRKTEEWSAYSTELLPLQASSSQKDTRPYPIETSIVYNRALDDVMQGDEIKLIVIGDNPGKDEQLSKNNRYLVGQSGKIAEGFFRRNQELGTDFRKNVIILNKTPIHTAKTAHLKYVSKNGGDKIVSLIKESQVWMAKETARLHKALGSTELWLVGYAELKARGIFTLYRDVLKDSYKDDTNAWDRVFVFQHFSMNRFLIDLKDFRSEHKNLTLKASIEMLGEAHKNEIFGG